MIVAIMGGGDWHDASVRFVDVAGTCEEEVESRLEHLQRGYREWLTVVYHPTRKRGDPIAFVGFDDWLVQEGHAKEDQSVLEFWE